MIKDAKPRPPNGPGSNGLRGGRNLYSNKTCVGPWLDSVGGPSGFKRGFSTGHFETEAQHQQLGVVRKAPPLYGAGLPESVGSRIPTAADTMDASNGRPMEWTTTTRVMTTYHDKTLHKEFPGASSNLRTEDLEKYRRQWTQDHPVARHSRYETESRRAANSAQPLQFQVPSVRFLPGTPRPVEHFRERLVHKYGILSFAALRFHVGTGEISYRKLQQAVNKLDIKITFAEFNQLLAYFTATDTLDADHFLRTVVAFIDDFESDVVDALFRRLFDGVPDVPLGRVIEALQGEEFPEVQEGIGMYLSAYSSFEGIITEKDFLLMHSDFYAANPQKFHDIVGMIWK